MIVLTWTTLLLFLGMAVDYGIVLRYRRAMQNACDAGALAGAHNLPINPGTAATTATTFASRDLQQNNIGVDNGTPTAVTLKNGTPDGITPNEVRVDIHATIPTFFYRLVRNSVAISIECEAKVVPVVGMKGLAPVGLNYNTWLNYYNSNIKNGACDITVPVSERPTYCQTKTDLIGAVGSWGSGNTGEVCLPGGDVNCGKQQWFTEFTNGSPGTYCADLNRVATVPDPNPTCSASLVESSPGYGAGKVGQGVSNRCAFPPPPASNGQILIMPLMNPATAQGRQTEQIWGFVAFQLSCPQNTNGKSIIGSFITVVTYQGQPCVGSVNGVPCSSINTGVETAILCENWGSLTCDQI